MSQRAVYRTTSTNRLDMNHPAMRLYRKAKQLGTWDPESVDLTQDRRDWERLQDDERDVLLRLTSLFIAGEEAVTLDLLPLIQVLAEEHRLEEEMYLTTFLWEEAKHVETFHRFLTEVARVEPGDLSHYHTPSYQSIFYDALPNAMGRLRHDPSPVAIAEASVTYNMVVEGILAETGYHGYFEILTGANLMPGMRQLVGFTKRDESRHIAFGVHLLSRLVIENGDDVWNVIQNRINELLFPATQIIHEGLSVYDPPPFGLRNETFVDYAMQQFQARLSRIERSRSQTIVDLMGEPLVDLLEEPALQAAH